MGHGVFGEYLRKIGWETTDICHHCGESRDTAQHTLELCSAWELSRYIQRHVIGERLTPSAIVEAMLSGPQEYEAVRLFCSRFMLAKKRAERERNKNSHLCRIMRCRGMAVRRPKAVSSPPQRTITRRGDSARGNAPPPNAKSTVGKLLGLTRMVFVFDSVDKEMCVPSLHIRIRMRIT